MRVEGLNDTFDDRGITVIRVTIIFLKLRDKIIVPYSQRYSMIFLKFITLQGTNLNLTFFFENSP